MIYITGDIHGNYDIRKLKECQAKEGDIVVICGDFGLIWDYFKENKTEKYWLDWLSSKPWTTVFVDGNHENFDRLYAFPESTWNGGKVHQVRENILHLIRGEIYTIQGKTFFAFGGARSHDIQDGVLEMDDPRIMKWAKNPDKMFRVNKISWWEQELPSKEEMERGIQNLQTHQFKVDYILSHDCPDFINQLLYHDAAESDILTDYFQSLIYDYGLDFQHWYFGHHHIDREITPDFTALYNSFRVLDLEHERFHLFEEREEI